MKKTVAIIGAANPWGLAISSGLAAAGYPILLTDDGGLSLSHLFINLPLLLARIKTRMPHANVRLVFSERDASWEADIVFPAVPREALAALSRKIRDVVTGKIVVGLTADQGEMHDDNGTAGIPGAVRELAGLFPHSKIVSANIARVAGRVGNPGRAGRFEHVMVSGDDPEALSSVVELIRDAGFKPLQDGTRANH